jgi:hypothetical protein
VNRQFTAYGEAALLWISMKESDAKGMRIDWLDMLIIQERLPFELGWKLRRITTFETLRIAADLRIRVAL